MSGQAVELRLRVRRFRCRKSACAKKTCAEPLADLVGPTARRTMRLAVLWSVFAIQSGGEPGARLWHVIKNWRETLERVVSRLSPGLEHRLHTPSPPFKRRKKPRTAHEQAMSDASRELRLTRYEQVLECYQQGLPIAQSAKHVNLCRATVHKYLAADRFPDRSTR
jgi:Helix-turn-helix domain of resolvase